MDIELVCEGLKFPEGPIAMADGSIILTEIQGQTLTRVTPDGKKEVIANLGGGPNGAAIGPDGACYVTNNGGSFQYHEVNGLNIPGPTPASYTGGSIQRVDLKTGAFTTLYTEAGGRRLEGPNDLVFDKQGGMWLTEHGTTTPLGRNYGGLLYAAPDGSKITRLRDGMISPNGAGVLADPPPFAPGRVVSNLQGYQLLDSLAVEAGGKVCVATIINGGVTAFDPNGTTEHFPFPDILCTNIVFGGADMRDAWIAASGTGKLYKCRWPRPGLKLNFNA